MQLSRTLGSRARPGTRATPNEVTIVCGVGFAVSALLVIAILIASDRESRAALGPVHFPITCTVASQTRFDRALALFHSMEPYAAERQFAAIAKAEPDCAIAYWGIAISQLHYPVRDPPTADEAAAAHAALAKANAALAASPREQAFIAALDPLFADPDPAKWYDRAVAYAAAMQGVAARYPDDLEANIFYALALGLSVVPGTDDGFARLTKASEILLIAFAAHPDHPGAAHYLTYCLNPVAHHGVSVAGGQS